MLILWAGKNWHTHVFQTSYVFCDEKKNKSKYLSMKMEKICIIQPMGFMFKNMWITFQSFENKSKYLSMKMKTIWLIQPVGFMFKNM